MRPALAAALLALLAACGTARAPEPHASRPDGIVRMRSHASPFQPVAPDWREAAAMADRRCRARGYARAESFAGWREVCRAYSRHDASCLRTEVTRFYPCGE